MSVVTTAERTVAFPVRPRETRNPHDIGYAENAVCREFPASGYRSGIDCCGGNTTAIFPDYGVRAATGHVVE